MSDEAFVRRDRALRESAVAHGHAAPDLAPKAVPSLPPVELIPRLRLHAYELVNGGANATQLRNDLNAAATALEAVIAAIPSPQPQQENPMAWLGEVCSCGCPLSEHESYGEDGESCEHDDHECVRTSKAVYAMLHTLREKLAVPSPQTWQPLEAFCIEQAIHGTAMGATTNSDERRYWTGWANAHHNLRNKLRELQVVASPRGGPAKE